MHLSLIDNFNLNILILAFGMIIKTHQLHLIGFGVNVKENTANDGCINYLNFQKNKIENKYFIEYIADFI
jgi:hypothetical protein